LPTAPDDWDLDVPGSRFTLLPAIGLSAGGDPEAKFGHFDARTVVEAVAGGWILEEQPGLGVGQPEEGSWGRGASAWMPVVIWAASAVGAGVIGNAAWAAAANVIRRLREQTEATFYVSRGMAATLAADHVAREFGDAGPFTLEAADEPSSFGGHELTETSYFGSEPWIVLLRGAGDENRYTVVVEPDGAVSGVLRTPIAEWQRGYLRGPIQVERRKAQRRRRWLTLRRRT
jgi:hypothetical protein